MSLKGSSSGKNLMLPISDPPREEERERLVRGEDKLFKGSSMTKRGAYAAISYMSCAVLLVMFNKAALSSYSFPCANVITLFQVDSIRNDDSLTAPDNAVTLVPLKTVRHTLPLSGAYLLYMAHNSGIYYDNGVYFGGAKIHTSYCRKVYILKNEPKLAVSQGNPVVLTASASCGAMGDLKMTINFPFLLSPGFVAVLLCSCILAFFLNYSIFLNTTLNSALTQTICGNLKDLFTIGLGWMIFGGLPFDLVRLAKTSVTMAPSMVSVNKDEDSAPRPSLEKPRRSLALPLSPLMLIDGLSRKGVSYDKLPEEPLKLSVLKLDGSSFDMQVAKTATVAELKKAVEGVFSHLPQKGPEKISWPHVWGHFCLCYNDQKLVVDTDYVKNYGIKDGDQLHFMRHVSISYNLIKKRSKKGVVAAKQPNVSGSPPISCDDDEQSDKEHNYDDKENRKLQHYIDQGCFTGQHETRLTRLLGEWFSHCKMASVGKSRVECLACPSRITTGFMGGFKKIIQRFGEKCCPRKTQFSKRYLVK
ncbi:Ubiquitin-related domain containing protein [Trema orientale]|uniref:Ubiquitin-related domain containing protein n=1 Tax=Trema orientale TaxID=63057 RepID=A0A2P5E782_TREOI|nr:Ubiquitin-related domain containing protein [Trema orientale]